MDGIGEGSGGYGGDHTLEKLLDEAGLNRSVAEIRALVEGVNAAPRGTDPDAWLDLFDRQRLTDPLRLQLKALRDELAQPANAGDAPDHAVRLAALRAELSGRGLAGFVVPRSDEHQGEYVPARADRLAWISGFTGSAGLAIVMLDQAAIFVDGRYTLQVQAEVSASQFQYKHLTDDPHAEWVASVLPQGGRLGYDPWLHTVGWVERTRSVLARTGADLQACPDNPIDAVWPDQPPAPLAPVVPHDLRYAGKPASEKLGDLAASLRREGQTAVVLTQPDSIAWLLNIRGADVPHTPLPLSFAIVDDEGAADLFIDRRKLVPGLDEHLGNHVSIRDPGELGPALDALGANPAVKVRVDPATSAAWIFDRLLLAKAKVERGADPTALPKARKNEVELEGTRAAHLRDGVAVARFLAWLVADGARAARWDEIEAAARLKEFRREGDLFRDSQLRDDLRLRSQRRHRALPRHREKTERRLAPGSLYLIDSGAQYLDGTTDITRTVAIGEPTAEMRERFTLVLKGHIALATARFPKGTTGSQLDCLARMRALAGGPRLRPWHRPRRRQPICASTRGRSASPRSRIPWRWNPA